MKFGDSPLFTEADREEIMKQLTIKCPKCKEILEIDVKKGSVVKHHAELKPKPGADFMAERLQSLKEEKAKREAMVAESRTREKTRHQKHEELFKKVQEQTKEGPPEDRPLREIDID
jgi:phage FluMu protein Com